MTVLEWMRQAEARLRGFEVSSPGMEAQLLAAHTLRVDRVWLFAHPDAEINELAAEALLQRRENGEPLAYILGSKEFFGREFGVDDSVLIPRHETEILVETALEMFSPDKNPIAPRDLKVLDIGTGSGVIAVTLKLERPDWEVTAIDISPDALATSSANAKFHSANVRFVLSDGFDSLLGESYDLIVSNPPYIGRTEELPVEVKSFEPDLALFAENNGLSFFERLAQEGGSYLQEHGALLVEVGYLQAEKVKRIFLDRGWILEREINDLSGILRVLGFRHEFDCVTSEE